jgi:hypothetical protein
MMQQQNIQAQAQANAQAQQVAAQAEVQKNQAITSQKSSVRANKIAARYAKNASKKLRLKKN